mmetsp:Transcript_12142/g.28791  ORF Transcript_12142/g.28791 Transcript_12142/m.28791 type:complete len:275 (+) Transcript_12142:1931-2755(+)
MSASFCFRMSSMLASLSLPLLSTSRSFVRAYTLRSAAPRRCSNSLCSSSTSSCETLWAFFASFSFASMSLCCTSCIITASWPLRWSWASLVSNTRRRLQTWSTSSSLVFPASSSSETTVSFSGDRIASELFSEICLSSSCTPRSSPSAARGFCCLAARGGLLPPTSAHANWPSSSSSPSSLATSSPPAPARSASASSAAAQSPPRTSPNTVGPRCGLGSPPASGGPAVDPRSGAASTAGRLSIGSGDARSWVHSAGSRAGDAAPRSSSPSLSPR